MTYTPDPCSILRYGISSVKPVSLSRHFSYLHHTCHQLIYVQQGQGVAVYGEERHVLSSGQLLFVKKDVLIEWRAEETDGALLYTVVAIGDDLLQEFSKMAALQEEGVRKTSLMVSEAHAHLHSWFDSLQGYLGQAQHIDPSLVKIKILELLFCLAAGNKELLRQLLQWKSTVQTDIMTVVIQNIENAIPLKQLAQLSGRSLSSFKRDFQAINNMPPSRWIRQKKLEKARELVVSTSLSITDVCYSLGFENVTHFSRLFKSYFGCTPSDCKRRKGWEA